MDTIKDQLSFYASSLQLRGRRNNILASNIANAATPNYKARDISFEDEIKKQDLDILGWRDVPVNSKVVGSIASKTQPQIKQVFIKRNSELTDKKFNLRLFIARKISENIIYSSELNQKEYYYFSSLSLRTIIYKGLLIPEDIERIFGIEAITRICSFLRLE